MGERLFLGQARVGALGGRLEYDHAQRHMDLRGRQSGAIGIDHGLDHVGDQGANLRRRGVGHRVGLAGEDGMAHAGDFENGHART